jgi:hypothetical protein
MKIFWGPTTKDDNIRITMRMKKSNKKGGNDLLWLKVMTQGTQQK